MDIKNIKHKHWTYFCSPTDTLILLSDMKDNLINLFTDKVWEVE